MWCIVGQMAPASAAGVARLVVCEVFVWCGRQDPSGPGRDEQVVVAVVFDSLGQFWVHVWMSRRSSSVNCHRRLILRNSIRKRRCSSSRRERVWARRSPVVVAGC